MIPRRLDDHQASPPASDGVIAAPGRWGLGAILLIGLIGWALAIDPRAAIGGNAFLQSARVGYEAPPSNAHIRQLAETVLAETNEVWAEVLPAQKRIAYTAPRLVLYNDLTLSACGPTFTAIGPFYCPLDQKIYLDASFFSSVKASLGGNGDLAYTFLLAHEVGHHVQNELGILAKAQAVRRSAFGAKGNPISIRIELMADCYAGVFAASAENKYHLIEASDVAKLRATAQAIGDDRLEQAAQGMIVAATFTHGTSAQRAHWFDVGLKSGRIDACNTFAKYQ